MPSHSSNPARRTPQQERSTRRVRAFLTAAESVFAESGFEAATMTAIAERADSSIGALYGYFPDKKAVALALLDIYGGQIEEHWRPLFSRILELSAAEFASEFIDRILAFVAEHPGFLQLVAAPVRLRRDAEAKRAFRATLVQALRSRDRLLTPDAADLSANLMLQLVHGMMRMFSEAGVDRKPAIVAEFKRMLAGYLAQLFASQSERLDRA